MRLRELIVLGIAGWVAMPVAAANEVQVTTPAGVSAGPRLESCPGASVPSTSELIEQVSALDPLEQTYLNAEPIAHLKRFDPGRLRSMAGPTFLVGPWQQQLFFQRSIDPRNPYYGTGLTR